MSPPAVLVTGASSGIGEACVGDLAREGCLVFAGVRRAEDGVRLARLSGGPGEIRWVLLDVTQADQIGAAVETIAEATRDAGLAGLVNNAGIAVGGPLEYLSLETLRRQLEVNVVGLHAVTRAALPLIRRGRGRIVQVGSISGLIPSPFIGPYSASKHAVEALAAALRMELAPEGIHVAVIEPGQVNTPIWAKGLAGSATLVESLPPEGLQRYRGRLAAFRWILERAPRHAMPPERVAEAIRHALFAPEPRLHYVLGRDARLRLLLYRLLPHRLMDALVLNAMRRIELRVT
ncbi:MAG: SDR family oxidoreductase [Gemmatimonadales bacterium]